MLLFRSGQKGCLKHAETMCIDLNKSEKRTVIGKDNKLYSFRFFSNDSKEYYFASISEELAEEKDVIAQILYGGSDNYSDIEPSFIKDCLLNLNDLSKTNSQKGIVKKELLNQIYTRNFKFDDDYLSDILCDCNEGKLNLERIDIYAKELAEQVNNFEAYI